MKMKALVMSYEARSGTSAKNGKPWEMKTLTLIDMGEKPRCKTPIELALADEDGDLTAAIEGETIMVNITAIEVGYKDSIRAQGLVVRSGAAVEPPASKAAAPAVK